METLEMTLPTSLQSLVDRRLDLVDRVLQDARLSRSERTSILQELEGQIHQQLEQRSNEPTREDVLAVLADLDPPEAFLSEEAASSVEPDLFRREPSRIERVAPGAPVLEPVSKLSVWAGFLVSGVALFTALVMTFAVWVMPELTLGVAAIVQVLALVGATLGAVRLLQSPRNGIGGLEKLVAMASALTAPLTLGFLLSMAALFYEFELAAFVLPGFVGGAWMHATWLGTATTLLWFQGAAPSPSRA